ncbi:MAG: hypothetical protein HC769_20750 [Cyanobacteria bacterium CRU_2_1]|nr:hypothetical protein [Cyanobacteria bacterium RU_5_0]NJR61039.1 hypothetical protein [Cyanobacteria bacterium CRU_2_1]
MKSVATRRFWETFAKLPPPIQTLAKKIYRRWKQDPYHPSLDFKMVIPEKSVYSVRIGAHYRVLGRKEGDTMIWFWIGSHEVYNKLINQIRKG